MRSRGSCLRGMPFCATCSAQYTSVRTSIFLMSKRLCITRGRGRVGGTHGLQGLCLGPVERRFRVGNNSNCPGKGDFRLLVSLGASCGRAVGILRRRLLRCQSYFSMGGGPLTIQIIIDNFLPSPRRFSGCTSFVFFSKEPQFVCAPRRDLHVPVVDASFQALAR